MLKVVPLRYGTAFKKAFSDPLVFSTFVHDLLGIDFHPDRIEQEHGFSPRFGRVDIKFDIFAEDTRQRTIIDLQHIRENETFDRFLYYHLIAQAEQIQSSNDYTFHRTVYTVVVLTRQPKDESLRFDVASLDSAVRDLEGRPLDFYRHRLVFVNPRCVRETTPPGIKRWLELFEDSLDEEVDETLYTNEAERRVLKMIELDGITPQEAFLLKEEAMWEAAKRDARLSGLDEGKKLGLDEGKKLGLDEGKKLGLDEGKKLGVDEGKKLGVDEGKKQGLQQGLREAITDLCELLGLALTPAQLTHLASLELPALEALRAHLKAHKAWPA